MDQKMRAWSCLKGKPHTAVYVEKTRAGAQRLETTAYRLHYGANQEVPLRTASRSSQARECLNSVAAVKDRDAQD